MVSHFLIIENYSKIWRGLLIFLAAFFVTTCSLFGNGDKPGFSFIDDTSLSGDRVETPEVGDSLALGFKNARPGEQIEIFLNDDVGNEWSYARVFADANGSVDPMVFWYHSGVIGVTSLDVDFVPEPAFKTFEEAEIYFADHPLILTATGADGRALASEKFLLRKRQSAMIYPSNSDGVLMNAMNAFTEDVFVSGRNFPAGSTVFVGLVPNQYNWHAGDNLRDITGEGGAADFKRVQLAPGQTNFTIPVWDNAKSRTGTFDIVARIGDDFINPVLRPDDLISYNGDTGMILYAIINGNVVIEVAGRMKGAPAKFEFNDSFEKGQTVAGAVDPTDVPAGHTGGNYAAYYVIEDQPVGFYDGFVPPAITDVSGGVEIHRVKYWCINGTRTNIWIGATQADPIKGYDVIVDFGAVPAMNAADFVFDNTYDKGRDFVDGYDTVGFYVFEDPSSTGTFLVGEVEVDEPNGIPGMPYDPPDPAIPGDLGGVTGPTYLVDLAWGYIMYPATATAVGTDEPVDNTLPNYPVALFMHGRHVNCDSNGNAEFGDGSYAPPGGCDVDERIPSHRGYDYIMERLASQGIIAISIDAFEIQHANDLWNYEMRGRLVLKWLDKLRDWNDNGTDPFGGIFLGKIDLTRVALSGHSRGGEGVVAAQQLNKTWPTPYGILAVNALAPTDQNNRPLDGSRFYQVTDSSYYLVLSARDKDVCNMQGMRTYDRAYPDGMAGRQHKMMNNIYGANHNFFNTVWTPSPTNPWAGAEDEAFCLPDGPQVLTDAEQQQIALTTISAFFRWHLQGLDPYKEIFTGRLEPSAMANNYIHWAYQDKERVAIDNFEQLPQDPLENTMIGMVTDSGFSTFEEQVFNNSRTDYSFALPKDSRFYHDTLGMKLGWGSGQTYTSEIPGGMDTTPFTHLTFRVAKNVANTGSAMPGPDLNLFVQIEDNLGVTAMWDLRTDQFDPIPHPYQRDTGINRMIMTGVRIPLRNFTMNASGVDLTNIVKVTIRTEGSDEIGIDDIEFAK